MKRRVITQLSIIIPVFNGEKYIERCISSIMKEKKFEKNVNIIIVDDGSTDRTYEVMARLAQQYSNVQIFHKKNGGVSSARNFGLKVASGQFVLFVDADDTLTSSALSSIMKEIKENKADYYIFPLEKEVKKGFVQKQNYSVTEKTVSVDEAYEYFYVDGNNGPWSKLFKLEIIQESNLHFHEELKIHEDVIFCMEYLEHCKDVRYCKDVIYSYLFNDMGAVRKHKIEYLNNYSMVYYLWLAYLKRHDLDRYIKELNCTFLHKMLTTSAKLAKYGISINEINQKLNDNQLFNEFKSIHFNRIRWKLEKILLIHKLYYLISLKVK